MSDSFKARSTLNVNGKQHTIWSFANLPQDKLARLPYSLKILLENLLRFEDGVNVTSKDIEALLGLADRPDTPCDDADLIARTHLGMVEEKISQLTGLRDELARMVACCGTGKVGDCRVIEVLSDHELCAHERH